MTTPNVPLRLSFSVDVPSTPEQVWDAIATANGISSWFLRTDLEEREGGAICTHMGEEAESPGTVTGWNPPHRFAYEEPKWAAMSGHDVASVTPLATEFLVEAQPGGSCIVQVVSSALGAGADWEQEFFADMEKYWAPYFHHLRLYLTYFPGQRATLLEAGADLPGSAEAILSAMRQILDVKEVGQPVESRGLTGQVERITDMELLLRLTDPIPGLLAFFAIPKNDDMSMASMQGYLFSENAADFVERERPAWKAWLQNLSIPTV